MTVTRKDVPLKTFLHYSDPTARQERTVFGAPRAELFYNYNDRLIGEKWFEGLRLAAEQAKPQSARYYEIALNHFHDTDTVNLEHVVLGCNLGNGCSYLIFGYTYQPVEAAVCPVCENKPCDVRDLKDCPGCHGTGKATN